VANGESDVDYAREPDRLENAGSVKFDPSLFRGPSREARGRRRMKTERQWQKKSAKNFGKCGSARHPREQRNELLNHLPIELRPGKLALRYISEPQSKDNSYACDSIFQAG
jgi:hypothetical protein